MAGEDPEVRSARYIRGLDIPHLADGQHLTAHQPQVDRSIYEGDRQHDAADALTKHGDKRDREDEYRKGLQNICGAHDECAEGGAPSPLPLIISCQSADRAADILANDGVRIGGTDFDRQLSLGVIMPLFGFGSAMKREGLDVPSSYFHDLATWSNINRMYEPRVIADIRSVRQEASEPALLDRLIQVVEEQRGHTLAMEVEDAKIALSNKRQADIPLEWIEPGLHAGISRPDLVSHTRQLAERIAARIKNCLTQARLSAGDIDAVFLTGGSVKLAHVRKAITKAVPAARIVEGDIFGAVGKGLTLEALRRYGPHG